jgi:hypothetical protein
MNEDLKEKISIGFVLVVLAFVYATIIAVAM